ncbi:MAG: OmpA family protein [Sediminicola sp.]
MPYKSLGGKTPYYSDALTVKTIDGYKNDTLRISLHLEPIFEVGKKIVLEDLHYDIDSHNIREDASDILNDLSRIMRDYPTLEIELSSHSDSRGGHSYNEGLCGRRTKAEVDYLVGRRISGSRL